MREKNSLEMNFTDILADFTTEPEETTDPNSRLAVTFWLKPEEKARYDRLQRKTRKRFSKKAKQAFLVFMGLAEAKAS